MAGQNVTVHNNLTEQLPTVVHNTSSPDDCATVVFSEMEFLPWDNPHNIVSTETEIVVYQVHYNLMVLLFLIGGPANVINMAVFYKQGLKDRVNLCLFALALADGSFLAYAVLLQFEQVYTQFTTKERFGPVLTILTNANMAFPFGFCYVSYVMSTIIATERCLCIYNPLKFRTLLSTKTMALIIIVVYVLVLGANFFAAFRYRIGCLFDPESGITIFTGVEGEFYRKHKQFLDPLESVFFGLVLPGIVFTVVTTATIMTTVKLRQVVKWRSEASSSISAHEIAVTKTLVASSIFFIICMIPGAMNRFSWLFIPEMNIGRHHHNFFMVILWITHLFLYINSTFNFFVYYTMGSRFRETFWALFGKKAQTERKITAPQLPS